MVAHGADVMNTLAAHMVGLAVVLLPACAARGAPQVDALVAALTSEDAKVAEEARAKLEGMGAEVVPALFEKLPKADWTLKPRLLEVLSANGREFAKQKLLKGNETENIYAALVYELSVTCAAEDFDYDAPEFKAMVEALLRAIKSEDKNLRAAAGYALVYDEKSTVFFDHLHEIVPALISCFDTELIIDRHNRGGPAEVVHIGIWIMLDALIGDRLTYDEFEKRGPQGPQLGKPGAGSSRAAFQKWLGSALRADSVKMEAFRKEWSTWWNEHSQLSAAEIGKRMIERDLDLLQQAEKEPRKLDPVVVSSMLQTWTGEFLTTASEARAWWEENKRRYVGPPLPKK